MGRIHVELRIVKKYNLNKYSGYKTKPFRNKKTFCGAYDQTDPHNRQYVPVELQTIDVVEKVGVAE
jgi:hypothetical protein